MNIDNLKNIDPALKEVTEDPKKMASIPDKAFKELLKSYIDKTSKLSSSNSKSSKENNSPVIDNKLQSSNDAYNSFNDLKINYINDKKLNSSLITEILQKENSTSELENSRKLKLEEIKNKVNSGFYQTDDIIEKTAGKIIDSTIA